MKNRILLLIVSLLMANPVFAQTLSEKTTTKKTNWHNISYDRFITNDTLHRWQIGINTQFFTDGLYDDANDIFDSQLTPIEFMVRWQTANNQSLRFRFFGMVDNFTNNSTNEIHKSMLGLALGYEWQLVLGNRWKLYYGFDIETKRLWDNSKEVNKMFYWEPTDETFIKTTFIERTTDRISLLPLLGVKFYISPHLFLSTEVKIESFYEKYRSKRYGTITELDGSPSISGVGHGRFTIENNGLTFKPYTGIYLNLTF